MSEISARCFLFVGNISATICKNLIFKIFYLVRKVFLICAKSDILRRSQYIKNEKIEEWVKEHCGTVHTFQGKEANEVILVLGCDNQSGIGAAHWVGQKPNIINVAVSRAKYRIAVIGDYNLWKDIPNFQVLCKYFNKK